MGFFVLIYLILLLILLVIGLGASFLYTQHQAGTIKRRFPPIGQFQTVDGLSVHYVDKPARTEDAPVVVFLHGASGNLRDPYFAFGDRLNGTVRQIFVDRPGHGWSERGAGNFHSPRTQAQHIVRFLETVGVEKAIFVGHSWSAVLALSIGLYFPDRAAGLLLNAPVSHPWPGGINWYYPISAKPVLGWLFTRLLTLPVGQKQLSCATQKVFWPNKVPEYYEKEVGTAMVLVPQRFQANACDIARLRDYVVELSPRYQEIEAPVTLITGDQDQVLLPWVHSGGLQRAIRGLRRVDLKNTGHMPHHVAPDIFVDEILVLAQRYREHAKKHTPAVHAAE